MQKGNTLLFWAEKNGKILLILESCLGIPDLASSFNCFSFQVKTAGFRQHFFLYFDVVSHLTLEDSFHFKQQYTVLRSPHMWPSPLTFPWESCLPLSVGGGARLIVWETWVSTDPCSDKEILLEPWISTVNVFVQRREENAIHEIHNRTSSEEPALWADTKYQWWLIHTANDRDRGRYREWGWD